MPDDDIAQMIEDCEARDSIGRQLARTGWLSQKQRERLEQIWERIT